MCPEKPRRTCRKWHRESTQMWELPIRQLAAVAALKARFGVAFSIPHRCCRTGAHPHLLCVIHPSSHLRQVLRRAYSIALSPKQIVLPLGMLAPIPTAACHSSPSGLDHIGNLLTRPLTRPQKRTEIHFGSRLRKAVSQLERNSAMLSKKYGPHFKWYYSGKLYDKSRNKSGFQEGRAFTPSSPMAENSGQCFSCFIALPYKQIVIVLESTRPFQPLSNIIGAFASLL